MEELTRTTAQRVFNELGTLIALYEKHADECADNLNSLESSLETVEIVAFRGILRTSLMLDYINLDLCAAYRQYLSTELSAKYDKRQAMTKVNCIISEGYKKIYGFNESGHKKSFWNTQIKTAVEYIGVLEEEFRDIEIELKGYASSDVFDKEMRDFSIHYDEDPMKVFNMLASLSAEEVTTRCSTFLKLLNRITGFVWMLLKLMRTKLEIIYDLSNKN
jgi:hypothetical protein